MSLPPKQCLCCGREIVKDQFCAETPDQFAKRYNESLCRAKCKRLYKPLPSPKVQTMEIVSWRVGGREEMVTLEKEKRVEDTAYEAWIRTHLCLIPHCPHEAQSHHQNVRGNGGKGTKPSSDRCLPLCVHHHTLGGTIRQPGSYHGMGKLTGWKFWEAYGIDVETVIHDLNRAWLEMGRKFKEG
jgi:hypothetical protein